MNWLSVPKKIYFKDGSMPVALGELSVVYGLKRAFIISDSASFNAGVVDPVIDFVLDKGISYAEFFNVSETPSFADVRSGLPKMLEFEPDVILAVGDASVMSIAKAMWLQYENAEEDIAALAAKHNNVAEPLTGKVTGAKAMFVALGTTPGGCAAEMTPFAVLANDDDKLVCIADYSLVPEMAVVDADFAEGIDKDELKESSLYVLLAAIAAYAGENASCYIQGQAREAVEAVLANIEHALNGCKQGLIKLTYAGALAGMAFGNSYASINPEAGKNPLDVKALEKNENVADLAKAAGFASAKELLAACEALK